MDSYPENRWKLLAIVLLAPLMGSLDGSIVNVALPTLARSFNIGLDNAQWIVSSYLIAISALIMIFGKLSDLIGRVRIFNFGFIVFGLGSLLCALSNSLAFMIGARILLALGAAMFMSSNQAIIASIFPPHERGRALGLLGTTVATGMMIGPPLGGFIVTYAGWHWLFLINLPISVVTFFTGLVFLPKEKIQKTKFTFNFLGSILFMSAVTGFFYFILDGQNGGWGSPAHLTALALTVISIVLFIVFERRHPSPLIDFSMFKSGIFSISIIGVFIVFSAAFCINITQPFYLQDVLGLSPAMAGFILLASPLLSAVSAPLGGHFADKFAPEPLTVVALFAELFAVIGLATLNEGTSPVVPVVCLAIFGIGTGLFNSPNTKIIMDTAPRQKLGVAGSLNALARNVGMVTGIAIAVTITYTIMNNVIGTAGHHAISQNKAAYIAGMRGALLIAGALLLAAIVLTIIRMKKGNRAGVTEE